MTVSSSQDTQVFWSLALGWLDPHSPVRQGRTWPAPWHSHSSSGLAAPWAARLDPLCTGIHAGGSHRTHSTASGAAPWPTPNTSSWQSSSLAGLDECFGKGQAQKVLLASLGQLLAPGSAGALQKRCPHSAALPDEVTGLATLRNLSVMGSIGFRYGAEEAASPAATHQIYPQSYCSLQLIAELETIRELPNYCQLECANQAPITHTHAAAALTIKCQISLETSNKIKSLTFNFSSTHSAGFQSA